MLADEGADADGLLAEEGGTFLPEYVAEGWGFPVEFDVECWGFPAAFTEEDGCFSFLLFAVVVVVVEKDLFPAFILESVISFLAVLLLELLFVVPVLFCV